MTSASTWRSNSSSASVGQAATGSAVIAEPLGRARRAHQRARASGGHSGSPRPPASNTIQDLAFRATGCAATSVVVHRAAVQAAEHHGRQRAGGGRLVEDARVAPVEVRGEAAGRGRERGAEERVGSHVPGHQLRGVQVPALVEAALQRPAHQPGVQPPGGVHLLARADRQHVGRPVDRVRPGPGDGHLHQLLGEVGRRVVGGLVRGGDAQGGAVVVGAVVQPDQPGSGHVHHAGEGGGPVRAEHRLRGLDLQLQVQRHPVRRLQRPQDGEERLHLVDVGDLRQGDDGPTGPVRAERPEEEVQGPDAATTGRRLERLGRGCRSTAGRSRPRRRPPPPRPPGGRRRPRGPACRGSRPRRRPGGPPPARSASLARTRGSASSTSAGSRPRSGSPCSSSASRAALPHAAASPGTTASAGT